MKNALYLLPLSLLCACGATQVRPLAPDQADWHALHVQVRADDAEQAARLQDELLRTKLFGAVATEPDLDRRADLVVTHVEQKVIGKPNGPFCFEYALAYLTAGIVPEVCDQEYRVSVDLSAPASGRAVQIQAQLTQRRVMGLYGAISSMFGDWRFWSDTPGNPVLTRAALLDRRQEIDELQTPRSR